MDCVTFHPNCNYVASGSSDRSVRMWDCVTGKCVRLMTGHKAAVSCLCFSLDGRFLVSDFWSIYSAMDILKRPVLFPRAPPRGKSSKYFDTYS